MGADFFSAPEKTSSLFCLVKDTFSGVVNKPTVFCWSSLSGSYRGTVFTNVVPQLLESLYPGTVPFPLFISPPIPPRPPSQPPPPLTSPEQ